MQRPHRLLTSGRRCSQWNALYETRGAFPAQYRTPAPERSIKSNWLLKTNFIPLNVTFIKHSTLSVLFLCEKLNLIVFCTLWYCLLKRVSDTALSKLYILQDYTMLNLHFLCKHQHIIIKDSTLLVWTQVKFIYKCSLMFICFHFYQVYCRCCTPYPETQVMVPNNQVMAIRYYKQHLS